MGREGGLALISDRNGSLYRVFQKELYNGIPNVTVMRYENFYI
jgi:hypothetical protein